MTVNKSHPIPILLNFFYTLISIGYMFGAAGLLCLYKLPIIIFLNWDCSLRVRRFNTKEIVHEKIRQTCGIKIPLITLTIISKWNAAIILYRDWLTISGMKTIPNFNTKSIIKKMPL